MDTARVTAPGNVLAAGATVRRLAVVAAVWLVVWPLLAAFATRHRGFDLGIYRDAMHWWWDGHSLYTYRQPRIDGLGFTYPPFAAIALTPLGVLPFPVARIVLMAVNLLIVTVGGWWLARPATARLGWPDWFTLALLLPLGVALEPVRETVGFGQVNLVLALLVMLDAVLLLQRRRLVAGVGIGLATAVKLTPAVFLVYLVASRQWRAAVTAAGTLVVAVGVAAAVDWRTSWQFWTETLWTTSRVGRYDSTPNQSVMGLLARLADDPLPPAWLWAASCVVLLGLGLARAVRAHRHGDEITAFVLVGLTGCLLSPISWTHHLVWVYPAVLLLGAAAVFRRSWRYAVAGAATYGVFASSVIWAWRRSAPHHWDLGAAGIVQENAYVLALVALVALLPVRPLGRSPRRPPLPPPPR